jgi:hypothetical protein
MESLYIYIIFNCYFNNLEKGKKFTYTIKIDYLFQISFVISSISKIKGSLYLLKRSHLHRSLRTYFKF